MKKVPVGRADLARAYLSGGGTLQAAVANLLGFQSGEPQVDKPPPDPGAAKQEKSGSGGPDEPERTPPQPAVDVPFWQSVSFDVVGSAVGLRAVEEPDSDVGPRDAILKRQVGQPVEHDRLASRVEALSRLRRAPELASAGSELDLDKVVARLSRAELVLRMPRRPVKKWGQSIQVILDHSRRLIPYWRDQELMVDDLKRVCRHDSLQVAVLGDGSEEPRLDMPGAEPRAWKMPEPGANVIVLGDLGCLDRTSTGSCRWWLSWGLRLRANGNHALAVVPCHVDRCPAGLSKAWTMIPWESPGAGIATSPAPDQTARSCRKILSLLSFSLRVEPRMIRAIRRMLSDCRWDPGIESIVWQDEALADHCHDAAGFDPSRVEALRDEMSRIGPEERRKAYELVEALRRDADPGIWYAELLGLEQQVAAGLVTRSGFDDALKWFAERRRELDSSPEHVDLADDGPTWLRQVCALLPRDTYRGASARTLHAIWLRVHSRESSQTLPDFLHPDLMPVSTEPVRTVVVSQIADWIVARPIEAGPHSGSPLGLIRTCSGLIKIDEPDDFWEGGIAPAWADDWGRDDFGPWVDLRVEKVTQRLRWIFPGKFWMGSPEDEEGRYSDEGPRHEETIASGFWMFDTPCTQALWEAVMEENPSEFKGPDRPVESVSWDQCQEFLKRLNARCTGLELKLPSETQWEYACRAGTKTPRYREDLNEIAWYRENSQGETHSVAQLVPNDWGLYDTLGNVLEWCEDVWTDDYNTKKDAAAAAHRVIRGGSWGDDARHVRAAYRFHPVEPSDRFINLGFRCAEFRSPGPVGRKEKQGAERAGERGGVGAEHPGDRDTASAAGWINLDAPGMDAVSFATLTPVRVSSDVEQVVLRATTCPKWASAIGRDKYGLWAEFTIEGKVAQPPTKRTARKKKSAPPKVPLGPVRQRLRWIPPGRFLMGSPPDEEGRYSDEGPQHEVTIAEGFWMFDTPCTQALWEALMGENPSEFKSPDRPVEKVSWEDCRKFVEKINEKFDLEKVDLSLSLPSEAQWEYACRAGTTTATYAGPLKIKGENNAPILHEIAWYGGNSGIEFKLNNGWDASKWPEKQFDFDKAGTHPVARKKANPWGLYDMLGNVWEWCKDVWAEDYTEKSRAAVSDSASALRVVRGGSWLGDARDVRAACRLRYEPSFRNDLLGFRCAEFREGVVSGASQGSKAEASSTSKVTATASAVVVSGASQGSEAEGAEQPGDRDPTSAAARPREDDGLSARSN